MDASAGRGSPDERVGFDVVNLNFDYTGHISLE
jgi:hypothetical protein